MDYWIARIPIVSGRIILRVLITAADHGRRGFQSTHFIKQLLVISCQFAYLTGRLGTGLLVFRVLSAAGLQEEGIPIHSFKELADTGFALWRKKSSLLNVGFLDCWIVRSLDCQIGGLLVCTNPDSIGTNHTKSSDYGSRPREEGIPIHSWKRWQILVSGCEERRARCWLLDCWIAGLVDWWIHCVSLPRRTDCHSELWPQIKMGHNADMTMNKVYIINVSSWWFPGALERWWQK